MVMMYVYCLMNQETTASFTYRIAATKAVDKHEAGSVIPRMEKRMRECVCMCV